MKVLAINTYGGSLLLAAKQAKLPVVASLEDSGFGSDLQALNFPRIPVIPYQKDWPTRFATPWKELITIAHPPCSAFSIQTGGAKNKGTGSAAFACHQAVMDYALGHGTAALAIESVPGALRAKDVYQEVGAAHGYQTFFVHQNAVTFGVPQWRPRVWTLFMKTSRLYLQHTPVITPLHTVFASNEPPAAPVRGTQAQLKLLEHATDEWRGHILELLRQDLDLPRVSNYANVRKRFGLGNVFASSFPRFLEPYGFAATLLADSWWFDGQRSLSVGEYCRIMGFPSDYQWGSKARQFRTYLSKGICPPVGAWVLQQLAMNLRPATSRTPGAQQVNPGEVLDLQPSRKSALDAVSPT